MKRATLACLAALSLAVGPAALAQPAPEARTAQEGPVNARAPDARTSEPRASEPRVPEARAPEARRSDPRTAERSPAAGRAGAVRGSERRRRTYAACNRASHQRQLTGGRRRRFLIRCRLGYERPRQPAAGQPAPPAGRRP